MEMWDTQKADLRKQMRGLLKAVSAGGKDGLGPGGLPPCPFPAGDRRGGPDPWLYGPFLGNRDPEASGDTFKRGKAGSPAQSRHGWEEQPGKRPWMDFFEIRSMDDLEEGAFRILEPGGHCPKADWRTAPVLVPGMAFTPGRKAAGKGRWLL